jgi:hypothetical protein
MSRKKKVKVYNSITVEFDDGGKLIIEVDDEGRIKKVYIINPEGEIEEPTMCKRFGEIEYVPIGCVVVREIGSYCICYRDSSGQLRCFGYPRGTEC